MFTTDREEAGLSAVSFARLIRGNPPRRAWGGGGGEQNAALRAFPLADISAFVEINDLILFLQAMIFFPLFLVRKHGATVLGRCTKCGFLSWNQSQMKMEKSAMFCPFRLSTGHGRLFDIVSLGQNSALSSRKKNFRMKPQSGIFITRVSLPFLTYASVWPIWQLEELS